MTKYSLKQGFNLIAFRLRPSDMHTTTSEPAIDCHVHVFDPLRFPYAADAWYCPEPAETGTAAQLSQVLDAHHVRHALIVGPNSGYGLDNRCLLDALAQGQGRYKGIAVVRNDASMGELQDLKAQGVVGVAFNVALLGTAFYADTAPLLERLRDLGMWAQVQVQDDQLVALNALLLDSGAQVLFDHCGRPKVAAGVAQAGFQTLLNWANTGRACVKLSGCAKFADLPHPYADARLYVQALIQTFTPQALVWASDWPFLRAPARLDYGPLRALVDDWFPATADRRAVLWETPRRLFGFAATHALNTA
jgi:predicted TIM-barrel fold metal-dependent hydrolase